MFLKLSKDEIRELLDEVGELIPQSQLDQMAVPSYLHSNPLIEWLLRKRHLAILKLAGLTGQESVLDFGCGIGIMLPTLCILAKEVHATDLAPQLAQRLVQKRGLQVTFHPSDRLDESIADGTLDLIIAQESMEHLSEPLDYVRLFQRKLKPSGRLIMSGPTENVAYRLGRLIAGFRDKSGYHRSNVDRLHEIITKCGLVRTRCLKLPFAIPPHIYKIASYRNYKAENFSSGMASERLKSQP